MSPPPPTAPGSFTLPASGDQPANWSCASGEHTFRGLRLRGWSVHVGAHCRLTVIDCDVEGASSAALVGANARGELILERTRVHNLLPSAWAVSVADRATLTVRGGELGGADLAVFATGRATLTLEGATLRGAAAMSLDGRVRGSARGVTFVGPVRAARRTRLNDEGGNVGLTVNP